MKKLFFLSGLIAILFLSTGCDKIKELTSTDVNISKVEFKFDEIEIGKSESTLRAETPNEFELSHVFSTRDLDSSLLEYSASYFKKATCKSVSINVYSPTGKSGNISDLKVATNVSSISPYLIGSYTLGATYTDNNLKPFAEKVLFQILTQSSVTVEITGETDLPKGEKLAATITIDGVVITVQLLD